MSKKIDINRLERYYCTECDKIHKRFRKTDGKKIQIYIDHGKFAKKLTDHEFWLMQFRKDWHKNVEQQKMDNKPIGLPKKDKGKVRY